MTATEREAYAQVLKARASLLEALSLCKKADFGTVHVLGPLKEAFLSVCEVAAVLER